MKTGLTDRTIKNLQLNNFRNYENESFEFSDGINILSGDNAQGKTNCAEAIFYLCTGKNFRNFSFGYIYAGCSGSRFPIQVRLGVL